MWGPYCSSLWWTFGYLLRLVCSSPIRWPLSVRCIRKSWRACPWWGPQMSQSFSLRPAVWLLQSACVTLSQQALCYSVNSVETPITAVVCQGSRTSRLGFRGYARSASAPRSHPWTRCFPCLLPCSGFGFGFQRAMPCDMWLRERCAGNTKCSWFLLHSIRMEKWA